MFHSPILQYFGQLFLKHRKSLKQPDIIEKKYMKNTNVLKIVYLLSQTSPIGFLFTPRVQSTRHTNCMFQYISVELFGSLRVFDQSSHDRKD